MDISTTVSAVRREYREYLKEKHPEWAENTLKTHFSDAFYLWNNVTYPSIWKSLVDNKSMEMAKETIYDYLKNNVMSDKAEERTNAYFANLVMLKSLWMKSMVE